MKNIFKTGSLLLCAASLIGFSACSDDNDYNPVIDTAPTTFTLNTPALSDQYIELSANNTVNLTWSQPNYSYTALATYKVQVGVTQDDGTVKWETNEDGSAKYLDDTYTKCSADVNGEQIAQALCDIDGITSSDDYVDQGYRKIAMRVYSAILDGQGSEIANTGIASNPITFQHMKGYCAIREKGYLYLIGAPAGNWAEPASANAETLKEWRIYETEIGTNIYQGSFNIPAGQFQFRFYSALTGWDGGASIGSQVDDASIEIALTDNVYSGDVTVPGKGNWQISDWAGGYVTITVNLNTNKVKFEATGSGPAVLPTGTMYVVGALSGWAEPSQDNAETYENYQLNEYDNNGIYTGTFNIAAGSFQFKIYKALTGWNGGDAIGAQEEDSNVDITLTDNVYTGPAVAGKGNWNYADWAGGTVKIEYNSNNSTVTFTAQ